MSQLSLFGAASLPPSVADVEGLLAGPGQLTVRGGVARISVLVEQWRARLLTPPLEERGLEPDLAILEDGATVVRTAFSARLGGLARRWTQGAAKLPPAEFRFDGPRLRWWCLAAGWSSTEGYLLGLGRNDELAWPLVGAALAAAGLPAALVRGRSSAAVYRLPGVRRITRLAELVGERPDGAAEGAWPGDQPGTLS